MNKPPILDLARERVLDTGQGLNEEQILDVLLLPDEAVSDALELAHEVRMRWCGPEVAVEGIEVPAKAFRPEKASPAAAAAAGDAARARRAPVPPAASLVGPGRS